MARLNAYDILKVPRDADLTTIEDAYDRLFDEYEPRADAGDEHALGMLGRLNEARDLLVDPEQRAALDRELDSRQRGRRTAAASVAAPVAARSRQKSGRPAAGGARVAEEEQPQSAQETIRVRRRSRERPRSVTPTPATSALPYVLVGVLIVALAGVVAVLVMGGFGGCQPPPEPPVGAVVATVNDVPIYEREFNEQLEIDRQRMLSDPIFGPLVNNFEGITGTRALDILRYDSLDKLINMEVIQQQAKKEGVYPTEDQQRQLINAAKTQEPAPGETFECFLQRVGVSEAQYSRRVIQNVVYVEMATHKIPEEGSADAKSEAWLKWICDTRRDYDVQPKLTFIVQENQPCTSGLPSDIPIPGLDETAPEPEITAPPPVQQTPAATPPGAVPTEEVAPTVP